MGEDEEGGGVSDRNSGGVEMTENRITIEHDTHCDSCGDYRFFLARVEHENGAGFSRVCLDCTHGEAEEAIRTHRCERDSQLRGGT